MGDLPEPDAADDAMVIVAALVSRVEALVVASMLEAAGVFVFIGGSQHASVQINSVALGGHRLMVPASQHQLASDLLLEVLGEEEWAFSYGLQRAVFKLWALITGFSLLGYVAVWLSGGMSAFALWLAPLSVLSFPVNPQGRGDYYFLEDVENA
jgi:hypothetical protein